MHNNVFTQLIYCALNARAFYHNARLLIILLYSVWNYLFKNKCGLSTNIVHHLLNVLSYFNFFSWIESCFDWQVVKLDNDLGRSLGKIYSMRK